MIQNVSMWRCTDNAWHRNAFRPYTLTTSTFPTHLMPQDLVAKLPDELVWEITKYLYSITTTFEESIPVNRGILSLACCNKRLGRITLPLLYEAVFILDIKSLDRFLSILVQSPTYALLVNTFSLGWYLKRDEDIVASLSMMDPTELIEMAGYLRVLPWVSKTNTPGLMPYSLCIYFKI
jgi:hypothetical protein